MKKSKLTHAMREMRGEKTQEQMAQELNISREAISKYENGRSKIPADISQAMMERNENPRFAFALRNEYTRTGPVWLNGPNADLHPSSVKEKVLEELEEAAEKIRSISFARPLNTISSWEAPEMEKLLEETVEAITAMEHLAVVVCEETGMSYTDAWQKHQIQLKSKGYVKA